MGYQALYRVWRPQTFDELVGQDMIGQTLKNAIKNGQLSHAYLFTGPRGTGKTSAAKILAKAVNCPHQEDGNPCNECEICQGITAGQLSDVIEIDAASNNGVEEIRDLRDKVRYAPTQAPYKVYIIDEVHMLTTGAFNALLKTLEEPPAQVIFILATTEPHKIPATIISRTQRFDFQRIQPQDLIGRMKHILDHDQVDYEEEALAIIARAANGGMRDSLSLLDQALSYNNEEVTVETALEVSGSLNQKAYIDYLLAIQAGQSQTALEILQAELNKGKQASRFIEELILFSRDILLTLHTSHNHTLLNDQEMAEIRRAIPAEFYYGLINQLNQAQNQMRFSNQGDLYLEVVTIQLAQGITTPSTMQASSNGAREAATSNALLGPLQDQVRQLEERVNQLQAQMDKMDKVTQIVRDEMEAKPHIHPTNEEHSDSASVKEEVVKTPRQRPASMTQDYHLELNKVYGVLNVATRQHLSHLKDLWKDSLAQLTPVQRAKFYGSQVLAAGPEWGLIAIENAQFCGAIQHDADLRQRVEFIVTEKMGETMHLVFMMNKEWTKIRQDYKILRMNNGGQPVVVAEEEADDSDNFDLVVEDIDNLPQQNEEDSHQEESSDLISQKVNSLAAAKQLEANAEVEEESETEVEELEEATGFQEDADEIESEPEEAFQDPDFANLSDLEEPEEDSDDENESLSVRDRILQQRALMQAQEAEAEDQVPVVISKAMELFGEENVTIYSDR